MHLSEVLNTLSRLAKENGIPEPYIVGGLPRDRALGIAKDVKDIDITVGNNKSLALAMEASKVWPEANFKIYNDSHSSLTFGNIRIDFSNNFIIPNIEEELKKLNIESPTDLQKEMYSRDFTINTILQPMDLNKEPIDITKKAFEDLKNKVLRTPIDPELTIGHDPRRIIRAVKMVLKFNLSIDPELKNALLKYRGNISTLPLNYIKNQINQMLNIDPEKTIKLLAKFKLLPIIPLSKLMTMELAKNQMVQHLLD
jgi:tRNA nucleotidyltransferase (CCA-adding enzyme)